MTSMTPTNNDATILDDAGPFLQIGFQMLANGGRRRTALSFATPNAFYVIDTGPMLATFLTGGGILEGLFGPGIKLSSCTVSALPPGIRAGIDPRGQNSDRPVLVLPRSVVSRVKLSALGFLAASVTVTAGPLILSLSPDMFSGRKLRRELTAMKWLG